LDEVLSIRVTFDVLEADEERDTDDEERDTELKRLGVPDLNELPPDERMP
jgi:hypothetical protein